ncbi:hypothetical protein [Leptolyngbya sp. NIES-2104]|uniref:hypothetical protein n=1 Tax=Leptolyngbya sp. NIES-2104 TaxID=1552121 RepID=UPI0006ECCDAE|nr:hypothetical protein [Leptolyngbya sp. NIES-2104]GAP94782.1 hypothetical protein NIES2104_12990 [Leptolyngbya sp. NIES-2104]
MAKTVNSAMIDDKTPPDVIIRAEPRQPESDPTLGIPVQVDRQSTPKHRLVTIGDSLTHGFQSGAIFHTDLSYAAMIAHELGWKEFRYPTYNSPGDGLPLNLEALARNLEKQVGDELTWWKIPSALLETRKFLDQSEDFWERGAGSQFSARGEINHNLAVYGWDLRNTLSRNADICLDILRSSPLKDNFIRQVVDHHNERSAVRVLNTARDANGKALSPLQAAQALSDEEIETLIIFIGANNALGSILTFNVQWSDVGYDDMDINDRYTVWRPIHFQAELDQIVEQVKQIRARHVIWCTVPHVTIVPFARGVGEKVTPQSRYFPYYTLFWIKDEPFKPSKHPHLTANEARAIDSAIDQYNDSIANAVREGRKQGKDWYLFEMVEVLDRLASRRFFNQPQVQPEWWSPYELPPALQALNPVPDSRFFRSNARGRIEGGLFSLDGIHATTVGYGVIAQELIKVMQTAGIDFYDAQGQKRSGEVQIDFDRLTAIDTLVSRPPRLIQDVINLLSWFDSTFGVMNNVLKSNY